MVEKFAVIFCDKILCVALRGSRIGARELEIIVYRTSLKAQGWTQKVEAEAGVAKLR